MYSHTHIHTHTHTHTLAAAAAAAAAAVPGSSDAREASLLRPLSPTTINANASFRAFNTLQVCVCVCVCFSEV